MNKKIPVSTGWSDILFATPVVLVSTKSSQGVDNVSPYGMVMPISSDPSLTAIGVHPSRDTYRYIKENGEFAINFLSPTQKKECLLTARGIPPEESEFDLAGLIRAKASAINVCLVAESPVNLECRLYWMKEAGDHDIVVGRILASWVTEEYYDEDPSKMRLKLDNLYHINEHYFKRGDVIT